jgi:hypothetical protein
MRLRFKEKNAITQPKFIDKVHHAIKLRHAFSATRTANYNEPRIIATEFGQRPHRNVKTLQRLNSPNEQQNRTRPEAECVSCSSLIAGRKIGALDTWGNDFYRTRRTAVQRLKLLALLCATHEDCICAADNFEFGIFALTRLSVSTRTFHAGKRVERCRKWQLQLMLQAMPG